MQLLSLNCNHCGAPLNVPESARFVTCQHCNVRLGVKHEGAAVYTEVLEKVADIQEQLAGMRDEQALDRIDREWAEKEKDLLGNSRHPPSREGVICFSIVLAAFGILMIAFSGRRGGITPGLVALGLAAIMAILGFAWVNTYESSRELFSQRRERIRRRAEERRRTAEK